MKNEDLSVKCDRNAKIDSNTSLRTDVVSKGSLLDSNSSVDDHESHELAQKEAQKREKLNRPSNENIDVNEQKNLSKKEIVLQGLTKELPKDLRSALIWNNVIAILVSLIYLTIVCTQSLFTRADVDYFLLMISLVAAIVGQSLSWFGTLRALAFCLGISILFLIINLVTSAVVIVQHSTRIITVYNEQLLFSLLVLPIIFCLSIGTVVLNIIHIRRIQTIRPDSVQSPKES